MLARRACRSFIEAPSRRCWSPQTGQRVRAASNEVVPGQKSSSGQEVQNVKEPDGDGNVLVKPIEPGPEDCCQTGCAECVWDIYSRNLLAYKTARAKQKGEAPPVDAFAAMEKQLYGG
ncbi:hypothetical protein WJX84_005246 [Apatococcus fuscideae]|uniref:Oxidoreductase-like domain-containing protein n=1 Tax=Apatococcus fuscideae TaxID=2026836 RepID=A0AAW1T3L8_9CHLO